ncbi:MAG: helix-turn-helix transcriptional regulator [Deltaproteobacteria bacterium]|nr:helix-turn-helix transcriptional regulator [Deltaproteobacteria bacterium]
MREASLGQFRQHPVGHYTQTASALLWCASPSLGGARVWGRPSSEETREIVGLLGLYEHAMAESFSVVLDTAAIDEIDPAAALVMLGWVKEHRKSFLRRVQMQANVIRDNAVGFAFVGILSAFGASHPFRVFTDRVEAFRAIDPAVGPALGEEIERLVEGIRGTAPELHALRARLAIEPTLSLAQAATALGVSRRSLQRTLASGGCTFRGELTDARFAHAQALLRTTDDKLATVAARVGLSERSLTSLFLARTGVTPGAWRQRSGD